MPIPGPTVHQQLLDAYDKVQHHLERERESILSAKDRREALRDDRGEVLDALAEHYLPELTQQAVAETWSEVRDQMMQVLRRKQEHTGRVELELADAKRRREQAEQQWAEINAAYNEAQAEQERIAATVEQQLRQDEKFIELTDRAAMAESALERAEANLQEIDQESARKLPAYDDSALFRYLYDRGYGTDRYKHRGFTRRMDRQLARYIGYTQAKQSYEFLSKTPDQMREIIAQDRQALEIVMGELETRRDRAAAEQHLPEAIGKTEELAERRREKLANLDSLLDEIETKTAERTDVEDARGVYYREAIDLFRELLDRQDVSELRRRAEQTSEITDDQIVARLMGVDDKIQQVDQVARKDRARLDQMHAFLSGLGRVIQRFRAAQFDSARSSFLNSLNIDEEVARAHEHGSADELWKRIRRAQRWGAVEDEGPPAANPMQRILVGAMTGAAANDRSETARRAGDRRAQQRLSR